MMQLTLNSTLVEQESIRRSELSVPMYRRDDTVRRIDSHITTNYRRNVTVLRDPLFLSHQWRQQLIREDLFSVATKGRGGFYLC